MATTLVEFIETILPEKDHYAYTLGLRHNAALQYYASNVKLIGSLRPEHFKEAAGKLFGPQIEAIEGVAAKCDKLIEALGIPLAELTNMKMTEIMIGALREKEAPVTEAAKPDAPVAPVAEVKAELTEAQMMTCPECGKKIPMPEAKAA